MAIAQETELYLPVKQYFEALGYNVKSEVKSCDLVAVHPEHTEPVIVELKKTFNLPLLFQGMERLKLSNQVYLAVERNRNKKGAHNQRWSDIVQLCRRLGLGFMTVTFYKTKKPLVEILCSPEQQTYSTRPSTRKATRVLQEFNERSGDYNTGGSTGRKLVTAYTEHALRCAQQLRLHGPLSPRQLRALAGGSPKAATILQKDYYGWFTRTQRGIYTLTPAGEAALENYAEVISNH